MEHETIDYFLEEIKTGKNISRAIKGAEREIRDKKIEIDETGVEICKIFKEDSNYSLAAIQGIMNFVVSVLAIYVSCVGTMFTLKTILPPDDCMLKIMNIVFLILPLLVGITSLYSLLKISRIGKEGTRLRNKIVAALIQMQEEKKETGKDEKNS